ncbi:MAG TPA: methyltransferase domain-containing protein [Methylibium sp.]|uniref:class I SAM-dependent methyltransferase n=1 Tax=Methylibium sp. TaxID=2067992 RepID=UPI002DBB95EB|nr:methyltransferase domain-containing protein [Methylibium sp.]HEU4459443.1 methyltransferase domain-containing protein [Methylibium sp.]
MAQTSSSIGSGPGLTEWLTSPPGRYLLEWEQARIDAHVADVFGFHALQLGLPQLDALRANRMPHRWLACAPGSLEGLAPTGLEGGADEGPASQPPGEVSSQFGPLASPGSVGPLQCDFDALPFPNHSLDLVVLPHTLELAVDAHHTLREVDRVLVPEGRVVILGFNPHSLWGLRQWGGRWGRRFGGSKAPFLPPAGELIALRRLRDWLRLLSFEVERGGFGCYRPPLASKPWLDRFGWMEKAGDRWWPMFGAVYAVSAVKRVRGMRVIAAAASKRTRKARSPAPAVASHTHRAGGDASARWIERWRRLAEEQA